MKNILSIIHYPIFGGPHNRNIELYSLLLKHGYKIKTLFPDEQGNAEERFKQSDIEFIKIPLTRLRSTINPIIHTKTAIHFVRDVKKIRKIIRNRSIDLVQINGLINTQGALAAKLENIPVVWQIIDTYTPKMLRMPILPVVKSIAAVIMCKGLKVAYEHFGVISKKERFILFNGPVNLEKFYPNEMLRKKARDKLGFKSDEIIIGNVGNINLQKGHRSFIHAAAHFKRKKPNTRFLILGATHRNHFEYAKRLRQEAESMGLRLGKDLVIKDPGSKISTLERSFDIFWMTSKHRSEGIPTAIEEAMALGIPVVSTDVGSIREIVKNNVTGLTVPPGNIKQFVQATLRLVLNTKLRVSISMGALELARRKFSAENTAYQHLRAYNLALKYRK